MNALPEVGDRQNLYRRLQARNRLVHILRAGVPAVGAVTLAGLVIQIYVASVTSRYGLGEITVSPEAVSVEAPEYAGVLDDGSTYRVWASSARAALLRPDLIHLDIVGVELNRADGVQMQAEAETARLDTINQLVSVEGRAEVADSTGTNGWLEQSVIDWGQQRMSATGGVSIDYADGTRLRAEGMDYDASTMVWTFSRATVTLPFTPGANAP